VLEFLAEYGLFLAKALTFVVALLLLVIGVVAVASRTRGGDDGHIEVRKLNDRLQAMRDSLRSATMDPRELKKLLKAEAKAEKLRSKQAPSAAAARSRTFVLSFHGDIRASAVQSLREEVTAVLTLAKAPDRVLLRLESGGGMVHSYGLAAAQLARIRDAGLGLTVCIDKVAASGGYLMACVAERIIAAPFAMIGSIGVVAQIPNFNRLLRKHDIDYEMHTAGQYKRTLTIFGANTDAGRQKFSEELEDIHALFKEFVARYRPALDLGVAATGEAWFGERAIRLGLVDELGTSDQVLQQSAQDADVVEVRYIQRRKLGERLGLSVESAVARGVRKAIDAAMSREEWLR
jgi:serine protease SohB